MNKKSIPAIRLISWPPPTPYALMVAGLNMKKLTKNEAADIYQAAIIRIFPEYEELIGEMVQHLPDEVVLLHLCDRVPAFILEIFAERLENGNRHNQNNGESI